MRDWCLMSWKEDVLNILIRIQKCSSIHVSKHKKPTPSEIVDGKPVSSDVKARKLRRIDPNRSTAESSGISTQFDGITESSPRKQLVIGLDFGTAFTKSVVGEERVKFVIALQGNGGKSSDYLLPSAFRESSTGKCSIESSVGRLHDNLKLPLIEGDSSEKTRENVAVFLALVLRRIRKYIFEKKRGIYGNNRVDWLVNVGLPTASYHDISLEKSYREIIYAAWVASAETSKITRARIHDLLTHGRETPSVESSTVIHEEAINVFPEFVAQITGYVRSPLRQEDLHALVDVGAGTLDVTVFNVHKKDGEDQFPIFAKTVKPLGTSFLTRHRIEGINVKNCELFSPFLPMPEREKFAEILRITPSNLDTKDRPFRKRILNTVGGLLQHTKSVRYPRSRVWRDGIPLFLCGGGANCDFYARLFGPKDGKLTTFSIATKKLPKPEQIEAESLPDKEYDRISVAYGLSFDPFDIGTIMKEDETDDIDSSNSNNLPWTTCPKCGGEGGLYRPCDECGVSAF